MDGSPLHRVRMRALLQTIADDRGTAEAAELSRLAVLALLDPRRLTADEIAKLANAMVRQGQAIERGQD